MPDKTAPNGPNPRPHQHLTVEELRRHAHITDAEWFHELMARGIIVRAYDGPAKPIRPMNLLPPDALDRFLKERGSEMMEIDDV